VRHAAAKHYKVKDLELEDVEAIGVDVTYKTGLLAKHSMSMLGIRDKSDFYDKDSVDLGFCISSASGLVASLSDIYLTVVWDPTYLFGMFCPATIRTLRVNPAKQLLHSMEIGRMPMSDVSRLADLIAMSSGGIKVSISTLIVDEGEVYLSVIADDPRIILALTTFTRSPIHQPIRFHLGSLSDQSVVPAFSFDHIQDSIKKIKLILTMGVIMDTLPGASVTTSYLESDNPMFAPESSTAKLAPKKPPRPIKYQESLNP
jgi:hypothetical protein